MVEKETKTQATQKVISYDRHKRALQLITSLKTQLRNAVKTLEAIEQIGAADEALSHIYTLSSDTLDLIAVETLARAESDHIARKVKLQAQRQKQLKAKLERNERLLARKKLRQDDRGKQSSTDND